MRNAEISYAIERETKLRQEVAAAARKAAAEVGKLAGPDKDFCDISYILGAMYEAQQAFQARA
jgi:hypothetical protein